MWWHTWCFNNTCPCTPIDTLKRSMTTHYIYIYIYGGNCEDTAAQLRRANHYTSKWRMWRNNCLCRWFRHPSVQPAWEFVSPQFRSQFPKANPNKPMGSNWNVGDALETKIKKQRTYMKIYTYPTQCNVSLVFGEECPAKILASLLIGWLN